MAEYSPLTPEPPSPTTALALAPPLAPPTAAATANQNAADQSIDHTQPEPDQSASLAKRLNKCLWLSMAVSEGEDSVTSLELRRAASMLTGKWRVKDSEDYGAFLKEIGE